MESCLPTSCPDTLLLASHSQMILLPISAAFASHSSCRRPANSLLASGMTSSSLILSVVLQHVQPAQNREDLLVSAVPVPGPARLVWRLSPKSLPAHACALEAGRVLRHGGGGDAVNQLASGSTGNSQVLGGDVAAGRRNRREGT